MSSPVLFKVPIPPFGPHPGGSVTLTNPQPNIYLLTLFSPPDNRLTTPVCKAILTALDLLEFGGHPPGVLITTSAIPKFYSNGLDLEHAIQTEGFFALFFSLWIRFLTFPMPTVALLNGHTFAGGLMLSMSHDYRLAPSGKGFLCLNELLFGAPLLPAMASIFRHKLPSPAVYRLVALEAKRFTGAEAVSFGLADALAGGLDDALKFVEERGLVEKPKSGVYGKIKMEMYKDLILELRGQGLDAEKKRYDEDDAREAERKEFGKVWFETWQKENKAKL